MVEYHQNTLGGLGVCTEVKVVMSDQMRRQKDLHKSIHLADGSQKNNLAVGTAVANTADPEEGKIP